MLTIFLVFIPQVFLSADICDGPWGKDAAISYVPPIKKCAQKNARRTPIIGSIAEAFIHFHQDVISPADGPRSHFIPSSSQYTLDAMQQYGFFTGFTKGCDRLMRENPEPWVYRMTTNSAGHAMKWDPVK